MFGRGTSNRGRRRFLNTPTTAGVADFLRHFESEGLAQLRRDERPRVSLNSMNDNSGFGAWRSL